MEAPLIKLLFATAACLALVGPAIAAPEYYRSADGLNDTPVSAATPLPVSSGPWRGAPVAGTQTGLTVASSTALTVPAGAVIAVIQVEGQAVRWRDDGTAPTASTGQLLQPSQQLVYSAGLSNIRFIQTTATATLTVSYYQ
jgi:hypothetical protein